MRIALYNLHMRALGGGERRTLALAAHLARRHNVTLIAEANLGVEALRSTFAIDVAGLRWIADPRWGQREAPDELFDVFINNSYASSLPNPARFGVYMCMFPPAHREDPATYQVVTANSQYTARWIQRRWDRRAHIVYSACRDMGPPAAKRNIILNVGRMFAVRPGQLHKNQHMLLEAFLALRRAGLADWELHLIGNCGPRAEDRDYVARLRALAEGHPVRIEAGVDFQTLRERYRAASVYWHAAGLGVDEDAEPASHEHLGMTIVEAMSAGAAPMVVRGGGPREVITEGVDGFFWSTLEELQEKTWRLIGPPAGSGDRLREVSSRAAARSRDFTEAAFLARMDDIIARAQTSLA